MQMSKYFEDIFSKNQCGFRKGYKAQNFPFTMLEKWKQRVDNKKVCDALLIDLSKAFDDISHEVLLTKLNAYGFDLKSLRFINVYLSKRKKTRVKILNLVAGVIFWLVFHNDLFWVLFCLKVVSATFLLVYI